MASFEESMKANVLSSGKSDPPETDLDYYSQPENYTGSNLQSLQRFVQAKSKENKSDDDDGKKRKRKKGEFDLFRRYRRLLPVELDDLAEEPSSSEEEEEPPGDDKTKSPDDGRDSAVKDGESKEGETDTHHKETKKEEVRIDLQEAKKDGSVSVAATVSSPESDADLPKMGATQDQRESKSRADSGKKTPGSLSPDMVSTRTSGTLLEQDGVVFDGSSRASISSPISRKKSSHRPSPVVMKAKMNTMAKELRGKMLREKFVKAVKMTMILRNIASMVSQKAGGGGERPQTFTDMVSTDDDSNLKSSGLSFDPSYFKARKEISISSEAKHILSLPSQKRSPDQVQTAMFGLQSLRSFAEYPLHMQEKLAKVAWYEVIPPKRIIIRQGHYAENFYFILSGQAVVTILVRDPKTRQSVVRTATIMRKGMSFGELALLHHSRRTATVTSQDTVQLLTIGREDFFEIFMAGSGPDDIPDHIKFVSQCDFMKDWPIEKLIERPEQCLLHFFKRNVVIVKDSKISDWLYVVKSGSCQVLKSLRGVTAKLGIRKKDLQDEDTNKLSGTTENRAKVDSGWRGRKRSQPPPAITDTKERDDTTNDNQRFSRAKYEQTPITRKAHFSVTERRKQYQIPKRNRPPVREVTETVRDAKPPPVFVQVEHLKPRDAFGLEMIKFNDDIERPSTTVSLVSRGAECIMLSKDFFIKHANELVKKRIRQQMRPYPDEETFQENLQIKTDWELYKHVMIEDLTSLT